LHDSGGFAFEDGTGNALVVVPFGGRICVGVLPVHGYYDDDPEFTPDELEAFGQMVVRLAQNLKNGYAQEACP